MAASRPGSASVSAGIRDLCLEKIIARSLVLWSAQRDDLTTSVAEGRRGGSGLAGGAGPGLALGVELGEQAVHVGQQVAVDLPGFRLLSGAGHRLGQFVPSG